MDRKRSLKYDGAGEEAEAARHSCSRGRGAATTETEGRMRRRAGVCSCHRRGEATEDEEMSLEVELREQGCELRIQMAVDERITIKNVIAQVEKRIENVETRSLKIGERASGLAHQMYRLEHWAVTWGYNRIPVGRGPPGGKVGRGTPGGKAGRGTPGGTAGTGW